MTIIQKTLYIFSIFVTIFVTTNCAKNQNHVEVLFKDSVPKGTLYNQVEKPIIDNSTNIYSPNEPTISSRPSFVIIKPGDGFYALAHKYEVSSKELAELNNLSFPYDLKIGQKLHLPKTKIHRVEFGENLHGISKKYGVTIEHIIKMNNFPSNYLIKSGEKIRIEGDLPKKKTITQTENKNIKSNNHIIFSWPIKGKIITKFGLKDNGIKINGINIAASLGKNVHPAASGVVTYIDKGDLSNLGNFVIIEHNDRWISTYAHLGEILVEVGEEVTIKDVIAKTGNTGSTNVPQLYFELRDNKKPVNPIKILPKIQ